MSGDIFSRALWTRERVLFPAVAMWVVLLGGAFAAAPQIPQFSAPEPVAELNTANTDWMPWLSPDGMEIHFASDRVSSPVMYHIYRSVRGCPVQTFAVPARVAGINQPPRQFSPCISEDGLTMYFGSERSDGMSDIAIWEVKRAAVTSPWNGLTQRMLPPPINTASAVEWDGVAQVIRGGLLMYFYTSRWTGNQLDLAKASRASTLQEFGAVQRVNELNTTSHELYPFLTRDEKMIFFMSERPGGRGEADLYVAVRENRDQPFGTPVNLWNVNSTAYETTPCFCEATGTLFFASTRIAGNLDLFRAQILPCGANRTWSLYR